MGKKKKLFIIIGIVILVVIILVMSLARKERGKKVTAQIARREDIVSKVNAEGILRASNQVQIGSDVMGRLVEIKVNEGDRVKKGDVLCIIEQNTYLARLNQAKASLDFLRTKLSKAEEDLMRSKELFESKLISREQHEQQRLSYEMAKADADAALEAYNEAKENYNKTVIRSPVSGEVVQINKEEGEMVVMGTISTPGSVIMTIAERSKMMVKALIDETEIVKIEPEQHALIEVDALSDTTFDGKVTRIGGIPESSVYSYEEAVNFPIEIEIEGSPVRLYPGMSASCEITVGVRDSVVVIPYTSLGRKTVEGKECDVVFVTNGRNAKLVPVKVGMTGKNGIEIIDGVSDGDTVLTGPYKTLRELEDGDLVEVEVKQNSIFGEEGKETSGARERRGSVRVRVGG